MRKAVVLIHGIGEQYPMENLRELAESLKPTDGHMYSSPNRIIDDLETRRLSYRNRHTDFYEFYWANLVEEPSMKDILIWLFKIFFTKKKSERSIRVLPFVVFIALLLIFFASLAWKFQAYLFDLDNIIANGILAFIVIKVLWPILKGILSDSILGILGDVVKYTIPSPKNIAVRNAIRTKGIDLIKKLHEVKDEKGKDIYGSIVVIGHSLGSIIGYDILANVFTEYHKSTKLCVTEIKEDGITKSPDQKELLDLIQYSTDNYEKINTFDPSKYQDLQSAAVKNFKKFGYKWKISDFISLGSPLTHGSMILDKSNDSFNKKKELREFPTAPPIPDPNDKFKFCFLRTEGDILVPHHAGHFALTRWTNVYFNNDFIGGKVASIFGLGVMDIEVVPEKFHTFGSHTKYWDKDETKVLDILKRILQI